MYLGSPNISHTEEYDPPGWYGQEPQVNSGLTQYGDPDIYVNMLDSDPYFNDEESSDSLSMLCALIDFTLEGFGAISVIESNTPVTALCDTWANQISEEVKEGRMSPFDAMFFANIIQVNPPFGQVEVLTIMDVGKQHLTYQDYITLARSALVKLAEQESCVKVQARAQQLRTAINDNNSREAEQVVETFGNLGDGMLGFKAYVDQQREAQKNWTPREKEILFQNDEEDDELTILRTKLMTKKRRTPRSTRSPERNTSVHS